MTKTKPYKIPDGYLQWNNFEETLLEIKACSTFGFPSNIKALAESFDIWSKGYPLYCVRQGLLEDMLKTDVGEKLGLFSHIELPVPCYTLFFPKGRIKSPSKQGGSINYLIVRHEVLSSNEHKYLINWSCVDSCQQIILGQKAIRKDGTLKRSYFATDDVEQQQNALCLRNLVLQSILLLQYYPQLSKDSYIPVSKGFGFSRQNDILLENNFQFPRWLGEEKKTFVSVINSNGGSRKSTHFRIGHYRKLEEEDRIRIIWVRPAWVNKEHD